MFARARTRRVTARRTSHHVVRVGTTHLGNIASQPLRRHCVQSARIVSYDEVILPGPESLNTGDRG